MTTKHRFERELDPTAGRGESALGDPTDPRIGSAAPTSPPPRRDQLAALSGLTLLAGIWLIIAPFVLGYSGGDPIWNDVVFGAIVAVFGLAGLAGLFRRMPLVGWLISLIGAWLFASAFWLDAGSAAQTNDVIFGIVVFVLGLAGVAAGYDAAAGYDLTARR
jgi:hypothetical protein